MLDYEQLIDVWFPECIDIDLTSKCNLRCSFCWGPNHKIQDSIDTEKWIEVLEYFYNNGTTSVVFSGGEPLLRKDIDYIIQSAKLIGYKITLSTNGILLPQKESNILPYIDEIGIPLDAHNNLIGKAIRIGDNFHVDNFLNAVRVVNEYDHIHLTVRTLISKKLF